VQDKVGNRTGESVTVTGIDHETPSFTRSQSPGADTWTNSPVIVTITATDTGAGLATQAYDFGNGRQQANTGSFAATGSYVIKVKDKVGNEKSETITIGNIDTQTPINGEIKINDAATYTTGQRVNLTIKGEDNVGVTEMCISNTDSCSDRENFTGTKNRELTAGDGVKTVYMRLKDAAGNEAGPFTDTITLDTTQPTISFDPSTSTPRKTGASSTVTVTDAIALDTTSLKYVRTQNPVAPEIGEITNSFENNTAIATPANENGDRYLRVVAKDGAGNTRVARSEVFQLDTTKPEITEIIQDPIEMTSGDVKVTVTGTDNLA
jgi:hypothetical protein